MVTPLTPMQIENALQRGTPEELREFERLLSEQLLLELEPKQVSAALKVKRLKELGEKLFGIGNIEPSPKNRTARRR